MLTDADVENQHYPSVRLLEIARQETGSCGFHLTRSKWDPYPWVSGVDPGSVADIAGLKTGDCVLEVNGEDIIGQRITEIAQLVKKNAHVNLLLWNAKIDHHCSPETLCCGPMPTNFQRLTTCMSSVLTFLECPICLDTIAPPTYQCENGHLICMRCRAKSERCPVCRIRFARGRCLLADQIISVDTYFGSYATIFSTHTHTHTHKIKALHEIFGWYKPEDMLLAKWKCTSTGDFNLCVCVYTEDGRIAAEIRIYGYNLIVVFNAVTETFDLKEDSSEVRTARIKEIFKLRKNKKTIPNIKVTQVQTNKLLARLLGKASSDDNLSSNKREMTTMSLDSEFNTSLKAKSLSSNAIFVSPPVSRVGSISRISKSRLESAANCLEIENRPASYHGSYECLTTNTNNNNAFRSHFNSDINFYCPFGSKCSMIIKGGDVINHFQNVHQGPLVQYFKTPITLTLENILWQNEICYVINKGSDLFFLAVATDAKEEISKIRDVHLWMWYLGETNKSINYHMLLKIYNNIQEKPMLSMQCAIYSLCDISWKDVLDMKKGLYLGAEIITALRAVSIHVEIIEIDCNN